MLNNKNVAIAKAKESNIKIAVISIIVSAIILGLFFVDWVYVYNTNVGREVGVSGFAFFLARITGNYSSSQSIYGDLAIPFNYYAKTFCISLSTITLIAFIFSILSIVSNILFLTIKNNKLQVLSITISLINFVLLIVCFVVALQIKNGKVLSLYCFGNPACSIKSLAIIPAIIELVKCSMLFYGFIKTKKATK